MGPTNSKDDKSFYARLHSEKTLYAAWSSVRNNASRSSSKETRTEADEFSRKLPTHIRRISRQLRDKRFTFKPAKGLLIAKKGKKDKRPVVVAPIESRIVQRAILDIVQSIPAIARSLKAGFNFGGVPGDNFGVPQAVAKALTTARASGHYIRTDIKSFFTAVPRKVALDKITSHIDDADFIAILGRAAETELDDASSYGEDIAMFPLADKGVAQGSCLSPLLCNLLLSEFDEQMNARGVVCIRYIDDFILFGRDKATTKAAFRSSLKKLKELGLTAYDPESVDPRDRAKADHGGTTDSFEFLGCEIRRDRVRPSEKSRNRLLDGIQKVLDNSLKACADPKRMIHDGLSYADTLNEISNKIRGWGNTYSFCSDDQLLRNVDIEIDLKISAYNESLKGRLTRAMPADKRRILGLFILDDCNRDDSPTSARSIARSRI